VSANKKALAQDRLKLLLLQKEKTQELQAHKQAESQSLQQEDDDTDNFESADLNPGEKVLELMHRQDPDSQLRSA
jgi:hypothetical protein